MIKLCLCFLTGFAVSVCLMPLVIKFFKKQSAGQTILSYVEAHKDKNGTTTMGGVVFVVTTLLLAFVFLKYSTDWLMVYLTAIFFGVLGFMDDFLKVKNKRNLGLKPYQKIIGQFGIAIIFAVYIYMYVSSTIYLPFTNAKIDLGIFVIPMIVLVLIAASNSVNLTDGLDGLAGTTSLVYLFMFVVVTTILSVNLYNLGETGQAIRNLNDIGALSMLFAGSILGFLLFNTNKASIFMGDVGSLCLGGYIGASACLIGYELLLLILGFCFVFSAISVILQVAVFKLKKKRIFKMAPFHHHLQMSGLSEPKIVVIYSAVTLCLGFVCIIFTMLQFT